MKQSSKYNLTEGSINKPLIGLSLPMIIAFSFHTSFNFVDRFFVSQLGDLATAAIGMAFVVQMVIIALGSGVGMGLNSYISRSLGADKVDEAVSAARHSFFIAFILGVALAVLGLLFQEPLFRFLGADGELLKNITDYLSVIFLFAPLYLLTMVPNNIFRGWGDTVYPMKFMVTATLFNIILDPILIFGWGFIPAFGIKGAAFATGLSRTLSMIYMAYVLFGKKKPTIISFKNFKIDGKIIRGIFQVGLPASAGQIITSFSLSLIFIIIKEFGDAARAAYTIAFTYEMVAFLPVIGIGQAVTIMVGHNYGAEKYRRIKSVYITALKYAVGLTLPATISITLAPDFFAGIFAQSPEVREMTLNALQIISPAFVLSGIFIVTVSVFQGLGLGNYQLWATLLRLFGFIIPLAYIFSKFLALNGVWIGILTANVIMAIIMLGWFWFTYHRQLVKGKINTLD